MAATMRAMVLREFGGDFALEEWPVPEPGVGEVRVRVIGVGAGLTLEHARLGRMGGATPRIMGHELSGTIDALGEAVAGWELGTAVTATFYLLCGSCAWCASGRETLCTGMRGFIGTATHGVFAEFVVVPAHNLVAIPAGVDRAHAGVVADAIATPYHAIRERVRLVAGENVAVIGAGGGLGVHVLEMVRAFGGTAIAVEQEAAKLAQLERGHHVDIVVDAGADSWSDAVREAAGGHVHAAVDTVGSTATLSEAVATVGRGGTVVALGFDPAAELSVPPFRLISEEIVVTGTRYASRAEIARTFDLIAQCRVGMVVGATFPLAHLNEAFSAIRENAVLGRVVVEVAPPA